MASIMVSIGSNIDPHQHINRALDALQQHFGPLILSPIYQNPAVGFDGDDFFNAVVSFNSDHPIKTVASILRSIEGNRQRQGSKFSARTLDLDLLTYDQCVGTIDGIVLPRDDILRYAFVLKPVVDIAGQNLHPVVQRSYQQLWDDFDQASQPLQAVTWVWRGKTL